MVDIDSRTSRVGRKIVFRPLQWFVSHRGIFHSLFLCFIFSGLIFILNNNAGAGFFIGYFSHLILDCFTRVGIKLFYPLSKKKISFGLKTGGLIEEIVFVLVLLIDLFLFIKVILGYL